MSMSTARLYYQVSTHPCVSALIYACLSCFCTDTHDRKLSGQFVVVTWVVVLVTWLIVYFFLFDWTVIDATDPDDVDEVANGNGPSTEGIQEDGEVQTCKPMIKAHVLRRIFHEQFQSLQATEEDSDNEGASRPLPAYQMTRTKLITRETGHSGLKQFVHQVLELLKLRNTWMVREHTVIFVVASAAYISNLGTRVWILLVCGGHELDC